MSLHVIGNTFNVKLYSMLVGFVSKHALIRIAKEFDRVNVVGFDSEHCGCVLRRTHRLSYACELARYAMSVIPLNEVHVMWTRLNFSYLSECHSSSELSIQQEWDVILSRFKQGSVEKWMTILDMGYLIASRYNAILVCLSLKQNITIFPLRTSPSTNATLHRLLSISHVYDSHFVQVKMHDDCSIPTADILWCTHC
ncbi:uncharacterized protein [Phaseolus vulgaris]|uniref:uncharacterized protein n=1 Tax=Phaseolus vulgaris TaxID=3885 RepID=UPI0035CA7F0A